MYKMKDSGIEWIGQIPEDWNIVRVKQAFIRKNEKAQQENPVVLSLARSGVKVRDISTNEGQLAESYYNYNPVSSGDLLLNPMDLYSGANCSLSEVEGVISPAYVNLKNKEGYFSKFYDYYFKVQYWMMVLFAHGKGVSFDNRWTLNHETLMNFPIVSPDFETQKRIADFLDEKCGNIDRYIEQQQQVIDKLKAYKQSVITEAVTKGLDPDVAMKDSGIEWIGMIPEHWGVFRIANLYDERTENGNDNLPILSVSINTGVSDRELSDDETERIFVRSEDRSKYKRVYPGDLTYNMMRAWQGAFGAVRVDGMVSPAYIVARPKSDSQIDSRYIEYLLRTPIATEEMHRYSRGIADFRLRLYWPQFKNIHICVPDIIEQNAIADYIDTKNAKIVQTIEKINDRIHLLMEYKKSLIYEAVTGKLEV